ncbi:MAG: ribose-phosphate pyrophosphokinase [Anaerolineales bacterium]|nr:ribose-phosphate pyrophosphokinase [Anaerolineales bacterium]MCB8953141.1 ribose-phosphate pyrophosphokinase [Ardenticatenales bacterium]
MEPQQQVQQSDVRFFAGRSNPELAAGITGFLGIQLEETHFSRFSNDNLEVQLGASVRGRSVYIVQSLTPPVSDHLMELFMMLDIARGAGARERHAIIPYYSYARSDKKDAPRISIAARLIADLLAAAGATHVMTMQLHSPQVHGFFSVPADPLTARPLFARYFEDKRFSRDEAIVVAPDMGGAKSATRFADLLGLRSTAANKTRLSDTEVRMSRLIQRQVHGFRRALIYDDEIATGSTILELCQLLLESDVEEIYVICTHGLFMGTALPRLTAIPQIKEIVTTDTVAIPAAKRVPSMKILSVASIFGKAIQRNYARQSIGDLFEYWKDRDEL